MSISLICYLIAAILAALATFNVATPRFSLGWAAIFFIALGLLLGAGFLR